MLSDRIRPLCLIAVIVSGVWSVEVDPGALPSSVERAVAKYQQEVAKIRAEADEAVAEERADLIDDLEDEIKRYTKRGDLDAALAIRNMMEQIQTAAVIAAPAPAGGADLLAASGKPAPTLAVEPEHVQVVGGGVRLLFFGPGQREALLGSLPPAVKSLARDGTASGDGYQSRVPQEVLKNKRRGNAWTVSDDPGSITIEWEPPIQPRLLVLINRDLGKYGERDWGRSALAINQQELGVLEHRFAEGDVLVIDLGQHIGVSSFTADLANGDFAGLAGFEAH